MAAQCACGEEFADDVAAQLDYADHVAECPLVQEF